MLDRLTIDDFRERIGETFTVTPRDGEGRPVEAQAFRVELRRADPSQYADAAARGGEEPRHSPGREPFSLEFLSRLPHHAPQQTFTVEHEQMGTFDLFLVPLGPSAEGHRYEAVFG